MTKGTIISIEGIDGTGKETQSKRLREKLEELGYPCILRSFPNYESPSSSLVKMYLNGDFGQNANDVDPYIASTFFAADRYASYKTDWYKDYGEGKIIILDRYTTANMVHQAGKIDDEGERDKFLSWLYDFEFKLYGLPVPNKTFFLDVDGEIRKKMVVGRKNKITGLSFQDIHEKDEDHINKARKSGLYVARKYGWYIVDCSENKSLRSIDSIGDEILREVLKLIKKEV